MEVSITERYTTESETVVAAGTSSGYSAGDPRPSDYIMNSTV